MSRIENSPELMAQIDPYREEWRREALRTDPIDQEASRLAVKGLYAAAGLAEPDVMFFSSPMMCLMARGALMQLKDQLKDQLGDQLRGQLWDQLGGQLGDQLRGQLWDQLGGQLGGQLRDQLRVQLGGQLGGQLRGQLYQTIWFFGGADGIWLSLYDFGRRCGAKYRQSAHLDAYIAYAKTSGFAFFYPGVALVSDRPETLRFDAQRRLHADDGPAICFRDGWSVHAWRGLRVYPDLIENRLEITPQQIRAERNAEIRRAMMEIYDHIHGNGAMVRDLGAVLISSDTLQGRPRELYEVDLGDERARFIVLHNGSLEPDGSRRVYTIGMPEHVETPHDAVAWKFGLSPTVYREAVRT